MCNVISQVKGVNAKYNVYVTKNRPLQDKEVISSFKMKIFFPNKKISHNLFAFILVQTVHMTL